MLRTNLSTRPFYNERAAQSVLMALGIIVVAMTLFNVVQLVRLSASQARLGSRAAEAEREAERLRAEAARIRTQIDPKELDTVAKAAREANGIIDRRAFSWTELFGRFEATLPSEVRIKTVQPRLEKGTFVVAIVTESRRVEDVEAFVEALEKTGAFRDVLVVQEIVTESGLLQTVIEGAYIAPARTTEAAGD